MSGITTQQVVSRSDGKHLVVGNGLLIFSN